MTYKEFSEKMRKILDDFESRHLDANGDMAVDVLLDSTGFTQEVDDLLREAQRWEPKWGLKRDASIEEQLGEGA